MRNTIMYLINAGMSKGNEATDGHPHAGLHGIKKGDADYEVILYFSGT